tara:strand:- start:1064 stop:1540 length:477 start_codon:yes stop_codon:yes gene_type:complete
MGSQRETLKPFSIVVSSIAYQKQMEVGLSGTGMFSEGIYCNYVSVQDITTGETAADVSFFVVAPSSIQHPYTESPQGYSANDINVSSLQASAYLNAGRGGGSVVAGQGSIAIMNLPEATACKSITIRNDLGYTAAFAVTYGVVSMSNPLRDGRQDKGS